MSTAFNSAWNSSPWNQNPSSGNPRIRGSSRNEPTAGMYDTSPPGSLPETTATTGVAAGSSSGMYSSPTAGLGGSGFGGGVFDSSLPSGGSLSIGDMQFQQGNVIPLAVAQTNITPAMAKLDFTKSTAFPFLQELLKQYGIGGSGGGGLSSTLTSNVLQSLNPQHEQAALNAAEASAAQAAELGRQQGLRNVAGSGWAPNSPIGAALTAATAASRVRNAEEAKRNIRNDFAQQRVTNLAQAINAQNSTLSPIYSLLNSLMS